MFIRVRVKDRIQQVFQGFRISYAFDKGCVLFISSQNNYFLYSPAIILLDLL